MNIKILGTEYNLKVLEELPDTNCDGLCYTYEKQILVKDQNKMLDTDSSEDAKKARYNEVVRHEVIHAFFNESGLDSYSSDETLIEYLSRQIPKMQEVFNLLEVSN